MKKSLYTRRENHLVAFRPVAWNPKDPATKAKLTQMAENDQYLFENTANMVYRDLSGIRTTTGLKLIAGVATIGPQSKQSATVNINYSGEFDSGISPIITTGLVATNSNEYPSTITIAGLGSTMPDDSGFQFRWELRQSAKANQKQKGTVYCHYMALGIFSRVMAAPE